MFAYSNQTPSVHTAVPEHIWNAALSLNIQEGRFSTVDAAYSASLISTTAVIWMFLSSCPAPGSPRVGV